MAIRVPHNAMLTLSFSGMVQRGQTAETHKPPFSNGLLATCKHPYIRTWPHHAQNRRNCPGVAQLRQPGHLYTGPAQARARSFLRIVHGIVSRRHIHVFGQET